MTRHRLVISDESLWLITIEVLICYDQTSVISQTRWTAFFHPLSLPITEALYDTILYILYDTISSLRRPLLVQYDLVLIVLYDINLGATITTILSTWGVTIPIGLVSSTTDSIWAARSTI